MRRLNLLLGLFVLFAACADDDALLIETSPVTVDRQSGDPVAEIVEGVSNIGVSATRLGAGPSIIPWFGAPMERICLDGQVVHVWLFGGKEAWEEAFSGIRNDGSAIGPGYVDREGRMRFFARDRVIALYMGLDDRLVEVLTEILGTTLTPNAPARGAFGGSIDEEALRLSLVCDG